MNEEEKKAIEDLNSFRSISILYGNTFTMFLEQLKKYQHSTDTVLNLITKLQKENKEKDKQIDLMADEISYLDWGNLCNRINNNCIVSIKHNPKCRECIKQYFEKLAKEKGE